MACLIDQELTFSEGSSGGIPELSYDDSLDYSKYTAVVNNVEIPFYEVHYDGDNGHVAFTAGEGDNDYIAPSVVIDFSNEQDTYVEYYDADNQPFNGEITVSICEKESDSDACPDVPFSESAPEQYSDYFDEDGNFVPKESSGGSGDCPFTIATLKIVDGNGAQLAGQMPKQIGSAPIIYQGMLAVSTIFPPTYTDYQVPLYNGSLLLGFDSTRIISISGDIELSGGLYRIFGDATIAVEHDNIT